MAKQKRHPDSRLTVRQAFDKFYDTSELSKRTLNGRIPYDLRRWERLTENKPIGDITDDDAADFRQALLDAGYMPQTINATWATIRAVLRLMAPRLHGNPRGRGVIETVPYMKPVKVLRKRPKRVPLDDISRVYLAAATAAYPRIGFPPRDWWQALIVVAYFTALRKGDLLNIRRGDIDFRARTLTVTANKTGKEGVFFLLDVVIDHLQRIWQPERDRLFRGMQGTGSRVYNLWHELCDAAGVERFSFHDIRRTAASEIERVRPGMGSRLLQHSARNVTDASYLNLDEELSEAVSTMRVPTAFLQGHDLAADIQAQLDALKALQVPCEALAILNAVSPEDWTFQPGGFAYRGHWHQLTGAKHRLLQVLVQAGKPVDYPVLCSAVVLAPQDRTRESIRRRLSITVSELRRFLKSVLPVPKDWDPVPCVDRTGGGAYMLSVPPMNDRGAA